jgi:hypothetical protein
MIGCRQHWPYMDIVQSVDRLWLADAQLLWLAKTQLLGNKSILLDYFIICLHIKLGCCSLCIQAALGQTLPLKYKVKVKIISIQ